MSVTAEASCAQVAARIAPRDWIELASPGPRSPMSTVAERHGAPLRAAARDLARLLDVRARDLALAQAPRVAHLGYELKQTDVPQRAAWWLLGQWLAGYAVGAIDSHARLDEAEDWFYGGSALPRLAPRMRVELQSSPEEVWALLPYLLDPLGQGTRRQVLGSEEHRPDRQRRKLNGVYYTPADVAHYMATRVSHKACQTYLDPACGSGVFLRAALAADSSVRPYGVDIDPLAVEMAAFVLLATGGVKERTPWSVWHSHRIRFAVVDSLQLEPGTHLSEVQHRARLQAHERTVEALSGTIPPAPVDEQNSFRHLGALFPHLAAGADSVLSNPPYAAIGQRNDFPDLQHRFASYATAAPTRTSNIFLPFVELGWRLGSQDARTAFVVPLSIAYNSGKQFRDLRQAMAQQSGAWELSFFDRAPDALFGDDVKTRTSIVVHRRHTQPGAVGVTSLQRWTSRTRGRMWDAVEHTATSSDLTRLIPKVSGRAQAGLYRAVRGAEGRLSHCVVSAGAIAASHDTGAGWTNSVFVAPTAYNWLSCARDLGPCLALGHESASPFTALQFCSSQTADAAYAVLASRLVFWLWRVEGDAFHVPRTFLLGLPFNLAGLSSVMVARLAAAGRHQWASAQAAPVIARNRGKRTIAFSGAVDATAVRATEVALLKAFRLETPAQAVDLEGWYRDLVVVDDTEQRRRTMFHGTSAC
jgi:hypothetical protein